MSNVVKFPDRDTLVANSLYVRALHDDYTSLGVFDLTDEHELACHFALKCEKYMKVHGKLPLQVALEIDRAPEEKTKCTS